MIYFENGIVKIATKDVDNRKLLSFWQLEGMIKNEQWVELIREYVNESKKTFNNFLFDDEFSLIMLSEEDKKRLAKQVNDDSSIFFHEYSKIPGFIEKNWKVIAEYYYKKNCDILDGVIEYMFTFSDGEEAIKCIGFY